ncbi:hypothetical protein TCDM_00649 [Trypanosoma cruzi Dm28c]|uniref:Uncharacterized protein n=1 Tax=Trypanosoma cruzi Dm28c TaxID=1416333 RepID=V5DT23_TRYCR|nr:hypothetical protein TCDM_00649 [Trypanosoma cruzi Dm28c]
MTSLNEETDIGTLPCSFPFLTFAEGGGGVDSSTRWNDFFTFGGATPIEQERVDSSRCLLPLICTDAFDFLDPSEFVTEGLFDGPSVPMACLDRSMSPMAGVSAFPHVRMESTNSLLASISNNTGDADTVRNLERDSTGDDVSAAAATECAIIHFPCEEAKNQPAINILGANSSKPGGDIACTGPVGRRDVIIPWQQAPFAEPNANPSVSVVNAGWTGRKLSFSPSDSDPLNTDGVLSSKCHTADASCQTPPTLPRNHGATNLPTAMGQFPVNLNKSNTSTPQDISFLFDGDCVDCGRNHSSNRNDLGLYHNNRNPAVGHKNEGMQMGQRTPIQRNTFICLTPQQSAFGVEASNNSKITKKQPSVNVSRKSINVHGQLQNILRYVPYISVLITNEILQNRGGSITTSTESMNMALLSDITKQRTLYKCQLIPIFIQMFPCELRDRTIIVLNRVVEATCGPDIATVVGIEPRSETSFIALIRTNDVWHLIHKLRCRVLMDRHGFWYAENMEQYLRLKEYCESVRRLPQQIRHFQTDGLPCMPLVVELSRSVNAASVTSLPAPPSFDEVAPIATMERNRMKLRHRTCLK